MKTLKNFLILAIITIFFTAACGSDRDREPTKRFEHDLQGQWLSTDPSVYSGVLEIDFNRITISGYSESQTPILGNDQQRPFRNFTKGIPLKGYSEEGYIYIEDAGTWDSIPYHYWETTSQTYERIRFLRFTFGDRNETLMRQN
jgi:hypothetical protein